MPILPSFIFEFSQFPIFSASSEATLLLSSAYAILSSFLSPLLFSFCPIPPTISTVIFILSLANSTLFFYSFSYSISISFLSLCRHIQRIKILFISAHYQGSIFENLFCSGRIDLFIPRRFGPISFVRLRSCRLL